ncbi:helix-turn-helix domain-containing protein [Desulfoscipio gibsoniae]|uniref:Putative transcription factor, MBF1 like protein n=1 Tax=Desulfoscipio gibsoniae DSM 7213 TaxID=767817 RepID=R4KAQ5_9FIRM|nr:helix-turn-helix transcriptional regulator [Desulfoscipio gibsoniae]AGK99643.1 putative transcription factor, MBF1 like protein [Desulfoscipio gibsoniae DSM 7213]
MDIGTKIRELRKSKKLTQKELAKKINKSERVIQKYESGEIVPPISVIEEIAKILDVDIYDIILTNRMYIDQIPSGSIFPKVNFVVPGEIATKGVDSVTTVKLMSGQDLYDIAFLLKHQKEAYYNGRLLTEYERKRVLAMLKIMFSEEGESE